MQDVSSAISFQRPHFHLSEALPAELRLAAQRLLGDERIRPDAASVDLVVDQVRQLQHVDVAHGDRLFELLAGHAVEEVHFARAGQAGLFQHVLDLAFPRAVKHWRGEVHAGLEFLGHADDFVIVQVIQDFRECRSLEDGLQFAAHRIFFGFPIQQRADALAQLVTSPAQVGFQDLAHVHAAGNAQRIQHDLHRRAVCQIRHVFVRQNAGDHAFVAVAPGHFVAHAKLALHGDVHLYQLDDARGQLIAFLQLIDLLFDDLAQHVDLPRSHLLDLVDLLVDPRILVRKLDALQVAGGNALDHLAVEFSSFGHQALVGLLVVQVSFHLLAAENGFQPLQSLIGQNADLIGQVLFQPRYLRALDGLGALIFLLPFAGEDFHVHHRALDARRASERGIAHVAGFFAEDGAQQLLFRGELGFALGRHFAHQDVARLYAGANADNAALVQVAQRVLADVRNVARHFFRPQLGVARFDLELLDVDRGVVIVFHQPFRNQDGILEVVAAPGHEGHQHVASQRQLAVVGARTVGDHLPFEHAVAPLHHRLLIDAGVLVGALEFGERINVAAHLARELRGMMLAFHPHDDAL